jgi:cytochrome subunit of sulfide dehydrogenase
MLTPKTFARFCFVTILLVTPLSLNAEEITKAAMLSITCAGCHGTDGKSNGAIPGINGKSAAYIYQSLLDYRNEKRPSSIMDRHAKGYSEEELKLIADYFASIK